MERDRERQKDRTVVNSIVYTCVINTAKSRDTLRQACNLHIFKFFISLKILMHTVGNTCGYIMENLSNINMELSECTDIGYCTFLFTFSVNITIG